MFGTPPLASTLAIFVAAALVVAVCGVPITRLADRLADLPWLGEAVTATAPPGAAASLSDTVVSITGPKAARASLALAKGVDGIATQTAFLAVAVPG